jgi:hypothetical protein
MPRPLRFLEGKHFPTLPTWLNISDRKRLLSAGYPTLTELLSTSSLPTNPVARIYPYHDVTLFLLAGLAT